MDKVNVAARAPGAAARDWTRGSIFGNLLRLSWPIVLSFGIYTIGSIVDMIWIGRLGSEYIAAVGAAGMALWLALSVGMGFTVGARALVARFIGAADLEGANHVARQAILVIGLYGILVAVVAAALAEPILRLVGVEEAVVVKGGAYLRICAFSAIPTSIWIMVEALMQASGDAVRPLLMTVAAKITHLIIEPLLIFGWGIFPTLGIQGAAITLVVTEGIGMTSGLWVMLSGRTRLRLSLNGMRIDMKTVRRMVKIGIPATLFNAQGSFGALVLMRLIAPFGTLSVAAHSLCLRVEGLILMPTVGVSLAAGVLVGQNLGARQPERAERGARLAIGMVEGFTAMAALAIAVWAPNIVMIFDPEPGLVEVTSVFLRIAAAGYLIVGISTVLQNCLNGAGDTLPPTLITLLVTWIVQIPLAFLLTSSTSLGAYGVRWAIVAGWVVSAAAYAVYFSLGKWKHKRV